MTYHPKGTNVVELGRTNREKVRALMKKYLGIRPKELARLMDLTPQTTSAHMTAIRKEWNNNIRSNNQRKKESINDRHY